MIPRRRKPRRGELTREEKAAVRLAVYERAIGCCEVMKHPQCIRNVVLPWDGDVFVRGHLAHIKSKGAGGKFTEENLVWACWRCHLISGHTLGEKMERKA